MLILLDLLANDFCLSLHTRVSSDVGCSCRFDSLLSARLVVDHCTCCNRRCHILPIADSQRRMAIGISFGQLLFADRCIDNRCCIQLSPASNLLDFRVLSWIYQYYRICNYRIYSCANLCATETQPVAHVIGVATNTLLCVAITDNTGSFK